MHDMKSFHVRIAMVWNVNCCCVPLHVHFWWGVALVGGIFLLSIAHPVMRKYFSSTGSA